MKTPKKISLMIIALALLACLAGLVWFVSRPDERDELVATSGLDTSQGPAFEVRVIVPRLAQPLGGILPDWVVGKLDGTPSELRFDQTSPGAQIVSGGNDRLELRGDGWHFLIESDGKGGVASGTRLVFPLALGGRHLRLSCSPANPASGYLRTTPRAGSDQIDGSFLFEIANCQNAESGKSTNWPPSPLTVRGRFAGLSTSRSQTNSSLPLIHTSDTCDRPLRLAS